MPRQNNTNDRRPPAPGWGDVAATMEGLRRDHGGLVLVTMDREGIGGRNDGMMVKVSWWRSGSREGHPDEAYSRLWPTNAHSSMPSLIYWALLSLDHQIDAANRAAQDGLPF